MIIVLTRDHARGVLKERLNIVVTEDDAKALFAMVDADNDGTMSVREFAKYLMPPDFTGEGCVATPSLAATTTNTTTNPYCYDYYDCGYEYSHESCD